MSRLNLLFLASFIVLSSAGAQEGSCPSLAAGQITESIQIDGVLNEPDWKTAPVLDNFLTTVPEEKGKPSPKTEVRVLVDERFIIIGIDCQTTFWGF